MRLIPTQDPEIKRKNLSKEMRDLLLELLTKDQIKRIKLSLIQEIPIIKNFDLEEGKRRLKETFKIQLKIDDINTVASTAASIEEETKKIDFCNPQNKVHPRPIPPKMMENAKVQKVIHVKKSKIQGMLKIPTRPLNEEIKEQIGNSTGLKKSSGRDKFNSLSEKCLIDLSGFFSKNNEKKFRDTLSQQKERMFNCFRKDVFPLYLEKKEIDDFFSTN